MDKTIYENLSKKLPNEAIQRSEGSKTGKGYDTTGYGYQYVVNRLNETVGVEGWNYEYKEINKTEGVSKSGTPRIGITVEIKLTVMGATKPMIGGHISNNYTDALKGAITNGLKKAAGMFGIGKEAYEKTIDEDNLPPTTNSRAEVKLPKAEKAKLTIQETIRGIRTSKDKEALLKAKKGIEASKNYTEVQKNLLTSTIDIRIVELK
jgi:hypothetical protein